MNNKLKMAWALREKVASLDELVCNPILRGDGDPNDKNQQKADRLWQQHVELLEQVYPKPNPRDHIQATILDTYRDDAIVLRTSFANMCEYNKAQDQLGLDYSLVSDQVNQCEYCDKYYRLTELREVVKDGVQTTKQGFCSTECLKEDEFERRSWASVDDYQYDQWYDYNFPNGCDLRDVPQW